MKSSPISPPVNVINSDEAGSTSSGVTVDLKKNLDSHPLSNKEILFTRQRHQADRAGLHWDYRLVHGDKAYSWATKLEMPKPGKSILLFEQPVHDRVYALSKKVVIPKGEYGAGVTTLDFVRKATVDHGENNKYGKDTLVIRGKNGMKFLLKKINPEKYGKDAWLFKNLTNHSKDDKMNKYLQKIATLKYPEYTKNEFDYAFEGEGNPTRYRVNKVIADINRKNYESDLDDWADEGHKIVANPYAHSGAALNHSLSRPRERDYDHLKDLDDERRELQAKSGRVVTGPSKLGLGLGYGAGAVGLAASALTRNPVPAVAGGLAALGTGVYHYFNTPEKRHNRYMDWLQEHTEKKEEILRRAQEQEGL